LGSCVPPAPSAIDSEADRISLDVNISWTFLSTPWKIRTRLEDSTPINGIESIHSRVLLCTRRHMKSPTSPKIHSFCPVRAILANSPQGPTTRRRWRQ
jgi:hypothetical protein